MKIKLFLLNVLFSAVFAFGQTNKLMDSLFYELKTSTKASDSATIYSNLAWYSINKDVSIAKIYNDSAFHLFKKIKSEKGVTKANFNYAVIYRFSGDYKKALESIDKALLYYESKNEKSKIANALFQKGVIYSMQGNHEKCLKEFYKTLAIYEEQNFSYGIGTTYNSIGITYIDLKKYPEAIKSLKKAQTIQEELNDQINLPDIYTNLGTVYLKQKNYSEASKYFKKARKIDVETNNIWGLSINNRNVGVVLLEEKKYAEALNYLTEAYKIQKQNNFNNEKIETLSKLGSAHLQLGNYKKSESYLLEGLLGKSNSKLTNQELHIVLSELYNKTQDYKKSLFHYTESNVYKDSIFNENNVKSINLLKAQFDVEKKDKEIAQQQLQLEKKSMQNKLITGIAFFLLISSILSWLAFKQRQKRKNQELLVLKNEAQINSLESLIEGEEKERLRIAKELHDGVNGDLSAIKHKLNTLLKLNNKTIEEAVVMIDKSCEQVRAISHNLVPPALENFDLQTAASDYCANMNNVHKPKITFSYLGDAVNLPKIIEINIFRIIQELMTNSLKHADAKSIHVQLSTQGNTIQLAVEDNGKGFDVTKPNTEGVGISNIKHRVSFLNGEIDFTSNNEGTFVNILMDKSRFNVS